jgi:hypothetical protein
MKKHVFRLVVSLLAMVALSVESWGQVAAYAAAKNTKEEKSAGDTVFKVREMQGTDSDLADLDTLFQKKAPEMCPPFVKGNVFGGSAQVRLVMASRKLLSRLNAGAQDNRSMEGWQMWSVNPFGASLETLVGISQRGETRLFRPVVVVLTRDGKIIRGREARDIKPADIDGFLRVTPINTSEGANLLTFVKLVDDETKQ